MKNSYTFAPAFQIVASAACSLLVAACSGRGDGAANIYTFSEGAFEVGEVVGNRSLDRRIELLNPISSRAAGRLQIQFQLFNDNQRQTHVEYLVEWFDETGFRVPYIEVWESLVIGAASVETVTLHGPTEAAVQARVQVRSRTEIK